MAKRILLVEDNPASLELMRYLLQSDGHAVLLANDGQQAIGHLGGQIRLGPGLHGRGVGFTLRWPAETFG